MSVFVDRARPVLGRAGAALWSEVMDILFSASRRQHRQAADASRLYWSPAQPSGVGRLLLALAIITAIVAVLGHAADDAPHTKVASATVQSHQGAPR
jgi:hypothetical protein